MPDLTPDDMARLRVPLAVLPGFDPIGLFVANGADDEGYLVLFRDETTILAHNCGTDEYPWWWSLDEEPGPEVSLTHASTRDRVARWVAGRSVQPFPLGSTAPEVRLTDAMDGRPLLRLVGAGRQAAVFTSVALYGIADLDPQDPRLLPDGSKWVDAAALAAVARQVGCQHET
jgi:hypothetical protein